MTYFEKRNGKRKLTLKGKDARAGYLFILPFLIGFFGLFLSMLFQSISFSFSNMDVTQDGYVLTKAAKNGLEHYIRAFTIDPEFNLKLGKAIAKMCTTVPLIIIFSFFAANILNAKFKGRAIARSIFFFPVILTSGIILGIEQSDLLLSTMNGDVMASSEDIESTVGVIRFLGEYTSLPKNVIFYLSNAVTGIYDIVIASGVQILVFLAGLQSISPSLYEASNMEGATGWENFWKITFPMISPLILVNSLYTIIDSFTSAGNEMMTTINTAIFTDVKYGYGSAMAWIYFLAIAFILVIVGGIISRHVFYYD